MDRVLIVGCGDIGRRVARLDRERGASVGALSRSVEKDLELIGLGVLPVGGDLDRAETLQELPVGGATVFYFAPPPGGGDRDPRMRAFCAALAGGEAPARVVYISTSGVYGDCGGAVVTEETAPNPQTARARRRLDAETALRAWGAARKVPVIILRVTGIYGPGRLPVERIRSGQPVLRPEEAPYTNRIHAEDLARVCLAAAERGRDGEVFNVSDGHAGTMTEYFDAVADACGLPRPPRVSMAEAREVMTPLMLSYIGESRRMDNARMLEGLGVRLLYPDLPSGIAASLEESRTVRDD